MFAHSKVMFEIYRESGYDRRYRVVYFTELDEHNKEGEIARALAGEHCIDGYLREDLLRQAKQAIGRLLEDLNGRDNPPRPEELARALAEFAA